VTAASYSTVATASESHVSSAGQLASTLTGGQLVRSLRVYRLLYVVALVTAFLTAFYTFRAFFMTFYGRQIVPQQAGDHAHESPRSMCIPLSILAAFALGAGYLLLQSDLLADYLRFTPVLAFDVMGTTTQPGTFHLDVAVISTAVALSGLALSAFFYLGHRREVDVLAYVLDFRWLEQLAALRWTSLLAQLPPISLISRAAQAVGLAWLALLVGYALLLALCVLLLPLFVGFYLSPYKLSLNKFYFDEVYSSLFVWPLRVCASISYAIDRWFIDGLVNLCGRIPVWIGGSLRGLQMGLVPFYGLAMVLGMLTLIAAKALWGGE
jgi:NADH-quinone oxidoreductase subunit L